MEKVFKSYVEAINNSDLETAIELILNEVVLINSKYRPSVPTKGIELIRTYISETVISQNGRITIVELQEKTMLWKQKMNCEAIELPALGQIEL